MTKSKTQWVINYVFQQEDYESIVDTEAQAFEVVDDMENDVGGFACSIGERGTFPKYMRHIDEEQGKAYWVSLLTGEKFVQYRG